MSKETIMRQFYVSKCYGGDSSISQAETKYGVTVSPLSLKYNTDRKDLLLKPGMLISVYGEPDNVDRFFDLVCPGILRPDERKILGLE